MAGVDPITAGLNLGDDLIGLIKQVTGDPKQQAQLEEAIREKMLAAMQTSDAAQLDIEKSEIASSGWFNKPHLAAAWVCLGSLVLDLLIGKIIWLSYALGHPFPNPPAFMTDQLGTLLEGIFGLGSLAVAHQGYKSWLATP